MRETVASAIDSAAAGGLDGYRNDREDGLLGLADAAIAAVEQHTFICRDPYCICPGLTRSATEEPQGTPEQWQNAFRQDDEDEMKGKRND